MMCFDEYSLGIHYGLANQCITNIMKKIARSFIFKVKLYSIFKIGYSFINCLAKT